MNAIIWWRACDLNVIHCSPSYGIGGMATNRIDGLYLQGQTLVKESDFFKQLDVRGKRRYREKLQILGLCSDLYAITSENWESDPNSWPKVEFPDIFTCIIDSSSPHTISIQEHQCIGILYSLVCHQCRFGQ